MKSDIVDAVLYGEGASKGDGLYAILGCSTNATIPQILAEYRERVRDCHPDTAEGDPHEACERFMKLQEAKEILTDERKKRLYDDWLNTPIALPWKLWLENNELRMSIHWATRASRAQMITNVERGIDDNKTEQRNEDAFVKVPFSYEDSDVIKRRFRNYQI
uniref:J domain-containing protein n=1 Tax=Parascaris univalens TaxID=6257 RepID=A0A915AXX8_PARUN